MLQCDRCVRNEATNVVRLGVGCDIDEFRRFALCETCKTLVLATVAKTIDEYEPDGIREFCRSLTPDQAKQVELYVQAQMRKKP